MGRTLSAMFQKPQQHLNCKCQDFSINFEMKLKNKVPVENLLKSAGKPIAGLPKISGKIPAEYSASRMFSKIFKMEADFAPSRLQPKIPNCGHYRK